MNCKISILLLGLPLFGLFASSQTEWQQVPLRSRAQEKAGLFGGEGMQQVYSIGYAPSNPEIVYLVSDTSQVWKSKNGGSSWKMIHRGFLANGGISLAVSPKNENLVLVAGSVNDSKLSDDLADGIYRTTNGGDDWQLVKRTHFYRLETERGGNNFAFTENRIYAGTHEDGILKSTDQGKTWTSLNILKGIRIYDIKAHPSKSSLLYLATPKGLYLLSKEKRLIRLGKLPSFPRAIAINCKKPKTIYVSVGKYGVYKSKNGGKKFRSISRGLPKGMATYLSISPVDPDFLYVSFREMGGNQPYYTHNGGRKWHQPGVMDSGNLMSEITNDSGGEWWSSPIACSPVDKNIAITQGAGNHLEKTSDGGKSWTYSGNGYCGARAVAISWLPHNPDKFAVFITDFTGCITENNGKTFTHLKVKGKMGENGSVHAGAFDPTPGSKTIICAIGDYFNHQLAVTDNGGKKWRLYPETKDNHTFIAFHPQKTDIVYAGKYISRDKGKTWQKGKKKIEAVFPGNGDIVYAIENNSIAKSIDGGKTWEFPYGKKTFGGTDEQKMAVDPKDPDRIYVTAQDDGIYVYNGKKWAHITEKNGLEKDRFGSLCTFYIAVDPKNPNVIYAGRWIGWRGHANGIFRSTDRGKNWKNITANLGPEININGINVNPHNGYVYIGTSHGTWRLPPPYMN